jgi:hypothetical protein
LANKGIKMPEVEGTPTWEQVEAIKKTYAEAIATVKVVVMNDTQWFFDGPENEEFTQQKPEMIWDHKMFHDFGVPLANSTNVELFGKPWLYGDEIRDPDCHKWGTRHRCAYAADVDKDDGDKWDALIAEADDVYAKLQAKELSAATSSPSLAERWSALSRELDEKYAAKLEAWFQKVMVGADVICGAGGDVVIVNLAYQLNRAVADKMAKLIHDGGPVYVGRSAGTMITAKSMEMTAEVAPGWLENFSDPQTYKHGSMFNANDLDGDGVALSVMGALRLFESPFAMRPHFDVEAHAHLVLEKNKKAEAEFEAETGEEVCDKLVADSHGADIKCLDNAVTLLNQLKKHAANQDNPVFIPLWDGAALGVTVAPPDEEGNRVEHFDAMSMGMPEGWAEAEYMGKKNG